MPTRLTRNSLLKFAESTSAQCQHCGITIWNNSAPIVTRFGYVYFCSRAHRSTELEYWQKHNGDQKVLVCWTNPEVK